MLIQSLRNLSAGWIGLIAFTMHAAAGSMTPDPVSPSFATRSPWQLVVQWDNDLLTGTDRDYTNGSRIAYLRELDRGTELDNTLRRILYPLTTRLPGAPRKNDDLRFAWGLGLTQLMFTPEDPAALVSPPGERPYAGWLGVEVSLHAKNSRAVSSVTLTLGTTGQPSYARDIQNWIHRNLSNSPAFQGWDSQIPAEPTANLHFDYKRRIPWLESTGNPLIGFDGYTEHGASLGNFRTDLYSGFMLRSGYNLPAAFNTPRLQLGGYSHELFRQADPSAPTFSFLGFLGLRGSAVAHDITLDGPLFRDFDTGVKKRPLVGELLFGIGVRHNRAELSLSRTLRTREFKGQNANQEYGSVMLKITFDW